MLDSGVRKAAKKIIKKAFKNAYLYGMNDEDTEYLFDQINSDYSPKIYHGASKMCVFLEPLTELGYVVKIPLKYSITDSYHYTSDYADENDRKELTGASDFWNSSIVLKKIAENHHFFRYCEDWDYCHIESCITEMVEDSYVEQFFAKTYYVCTIDDVPIYIQEYIPDSSWNIEITCEVEENFKKSHITASPEIGEYICQKFMLNRSEEELKYLQNFMNFFTQMQIKDIHEENIRCKDGKLYLIDYSGFNW